MKIEFLSDNIGVAVSGGIDSMVLLHLCLSAKIKPCVINIEHGIRGESSQKDSLFVADFCKKHDLPLLFKKVDALNEAKKRGISVELAARELRYEFFEELLKDKKVDKIALAHHADDNAETILMRIFRGTGIRGLKGITDRDGFIRPLLKYSRAEIEKYAKINAVPFVEDETNEDTDYTRNFIRHRVLPEIKTRYPEVLSSFTRLASNAAEVDDFISSFILPAVDTDFGVVIKDFFNARSIIQKYSLNAALAKSGILQDVEYRHLNSVLELKDKRNGSSFDLPFGITAEKRNYDLYLTEKREESFAEIPFSPEKKFSFMGFSYAFEPTEKMEKGLTFDLKKVDGCILRTRRDGDTFHRVNGKKKLLSDFLNEKKLTDTEKNACIVLANGSVIYAILGIEVAEEVKIDENTDKIIKITKERIKL